MNRRTIHHNDRSRPGRRLCALAALVALVCVGLAATSAHGANRRSKEPALRAQLDAPMLFVKRHSYQGIHIYDTYYKWIPGGGIYVLENPWERPEKHRIRPVIDAATPGTLGDGIYSEPELSYDGTKLLFCYKPEQNGSTSIYEINIDGTGLRRITDPTTCGGSASAHSGQHDVSPAYLPDGRILFTTTRPNGLVPCANSGVDIMHVMNWDGSDIHPISINNVNEFDPSLLPDGRILYGRWEYVDKNALTVQSLWTISPDGTNETALFANNAVRPEALLDARPVPGAPHLIAASLTRHNAPPRGSVGIIDTHLSKNDPEAITNFDNPNAPDTDTGESCEPWPLSEDVLLYSGRPKKAKFNCIILGDRAGRRETVFADPDICCHSPMLVKPRPQPNAIVPQRVAGETTGRFFVQDIYRGLTGVERGEVKWLRVIEETSRASSTPGNMGPYNQTFLISAALAFSAKNILGVVPVNPDGSAHFEVPSGRALYLQALDADGRLVQSMRTFVHAVPGVTRSCIGCHERKFDGPSNEGIREAHRLDPVRPQPESWGTGYLDYSSMVQPILDKHCVKCHGGEQGFAGQLDLTGGWTENFNISYENLTSRHESQLTASLIAAIDCMNGTAHWSVKRFAPREHGSGAAPLAKTLVSAHKGRIPDLSRTERDLLMAWIDTNGVYYGTWDYSQYGNTVKAWPTAKEALINEMRSAGCMECHENHDRIQFENDWFNFKKPEFSRILRAPLARGGDGFGLGLCQNRKTDPRRRRIRLLVTGGYAHGVLPLEEFRKQGEQPPRDTAVAEPATTFASTADEHYQAMLGIIRSGRRMALAEPRVDMPGAYILAGYARQFVPPPLPEPLPSLEARIDPEGVVRLSWERSARTIGLVGELHRGDSPAFTPGSETLVTTTRGFDYADLSATEGKQHYALILCSDAESTSPLRTAVTVPKPPTPPAPTHLEATGAIGAVQLAWAEESDMPLRYHVYRAADGAEDFQRITDAPSPALHYDDTTAANDVTYAYTVRAVNRRGIEGDAVTRVEASALPELREATFSALLEQTPDATLYGGDTASGAVHGKARIEAGLLDLREGGHLTFDHRAEFDLTHRLSVEFWVRFTEDTSMPVVVGCGRWNEAGWFVQRLGERWRWYVGGLNCDGGAKPALGQWTHIAATFDGQTARLFQDGKPVGEKAGQASTSLWSGPLHIGQYPAGATPAYQVKGWMAGVKVYGCALSEEDARAAAQSPPGAAEDGKQPSVARSEKSKDPQADSTAS